MKTIVNGQYWGDPTKIKDGSFVFGTNDTKGAQQYFDFLRQRGRLHRFAWQDSTHRAGGQEHLDRRIPEVSLMSVKRKLILDVDTGIDDALALAYVSTFDDVELLGAIGTYGNVTADTAVRNTRYVLDWLGLRHVPVLAGSTHPSWADSFIADAGCAQFHGTDGWVDSGRQRTRLHPIRRERSR